MQLLYSHIGARACVLIGLDTDLHVGVSLCKPFREVSIMLITARTEGCGLTLTMDKLMLQFIALVPCA